MECLSVMEIVRLFGKSVKTFLRESDRNADNFEYAKDLSDDF